MFKTPDEHIELLARTLREVGDIVSPQITGAVTEGETADFYHGFISGLVFGHQLLSQCGKDEKQLARMLSLAAARAAETYLRARETEAFFFPDTIDA